MHVWSNVSYSFEDIDVKWSLYRPGVAQSMGRGIALLFHDRGTRRWWVVSSTLRPHFTHGKDPVPILQEAGWVPGPVWKCRKSRPHRDSIPDRPARKQSLYLLSYRAHIHLYIHACTYIYVYILYIYIYIYKQKGYRFSYKEKFVDAVEKLNLITVTITRNT